ncbi:serine/arginine repetitive matrix protein 2 [Blautia stercoris]|uniref:Serine/arginine repetitive matrix protein 2 n=1 Tax=Blautia stercoris TaxID=871664 RepID=A0ABR7PAJ8_9FIRM|nr:serine/arginine repetitive matrix protein 2 [Blautia stercoris]MBC8628432.1 serine/arginine repetitive matrix protein 2 [Blautia stercoris]
MKATRHNGRSGKHGTYDAKHNDRRFDVENSEHIDAERTKMNVYWDCYQGYSLQNDKDEQARFTFTEIEKAYYVEKYSDHVDGQNERNRKARHYDRVKTIDAILENNKTCPEETLLQLGNMDWALHLDEATPHIHERHVFDAVNQYGELCPQQDKALEELGFELPKPNEKKGKYNNRKIVFDEECRKLFISICQNHGLTIDVEPVYGGASYLEKQDFIIMNQKKRIEEKQAVLDGLVMKIEDVNAVIEEAVDLAYEKACEVVTKRVKEETVKHDVDVVKDYGELLQQQPKDKLSDKSKSVASKVVNAIVAKLEKASQALLGNIISALNEPKNKVKAKGQIKEQARVSIQAKLKEKQKQVMEYEKKQDVHIRKKNMEL